MTDLNESAPIGRSMPHLLSRLVDQVTTLAQQEARLARSEVGDAVARIAASAMTITIAAALLIAGLVVLLQAAVLGLQLYGVTPIWSAVIVGGVVLAVGAIMLSSAIAALKRTDIVPRRTVGQMQQDVAVAKEQAR